MGKIKMTLNFRRCNVQFIQNKIFKALNLNVTWVSCFGRDHVLLQLGHLILLGHIKQIES